MWSDTLDRCQPQFNGAVQGRVLLYDGDAACYRAAATSKRLNTCIRKVQQAILEAMFLTRADSARVHLTSHNCRKAGRFELKGVKQYQANRKGENKPPMLEPTREAMANPANALEEFEVILNQEYEADDALVMDSYRLRDSSVLYSDDKDLRMTPYPYFNTDLGEVDKQATRYGQLWLWRNEKGQVKYRGHGLCWLHFQALAGDTADNIKGLLKYEGKNIGKVRAYEALAECTSEVQAANLVLDAYRAIDQNPWPEYAALFLLRAPGDAIEKYFEDLPLSKANKAFLEQTYQRDWR